MGRFDAAHRRPDDDAQRRRRLGAAAELAPAHVVIMPIYRNDDERAQVLPYCATLEQELAAQTYAGEPVRVRIDDRDMRGGEKKWQ